MVDTVIPFDTPERRQSGQDKLTHREQIRILKAEVKTLRERLGVEKPMDEETWGDFAPQHLRDEVAASALIEQGLHPLRGLERLGFTIEDHSDPKWRELASRIFETPGVRAILDADAAKFAGNKDRVLNSLYEIGTDPLAPRPDRIRAIGQLAKMIEGWQDGEKVKNPAQVFNFLMGLVGGTGHPNGNGARIVDPKELPPGDDGIVDAESFFVERGEEVVAVVDEPK